MSDTFSMEPERGFEPQAERLGAVAAQAAHDEAFAAPQPEQKVSERALEDAGWVAATSVSVATDQEGSAEYQPGGAVFPMTSRPETRIMEAEVVAKHPRETGVAGERDDIPPFSYRGDGDSDGWDLSLRAGDDDRIGQGGRIEPELTLPEFDPAAFGEEPGGGDPEAPIDPNAHEDQVVEDTEYAQGEAGGLKTLLLRHINLVIFGTAGLAALIVVWHTMEAMRQPHRETTGIPITAGTLASPQSGLSSQTVGQNSFGQPGSIGATSANGSPAAPQVSFAPNPSVQPASPQPATPPAAAPAAQKSAQKIAPATTGLTPQTTPSVASAPAVPVPQPPQPNTVQTQPSAPPPATSAAVSSPPAAMAKKVTAPVASPSTAQSSPPVLVPQQVPPSSPETEAAPATTTSPIDPDAGKISSLASQVQQLTAAVSSLNDKLAGGQGDLAAQLSSMKDQISNLQAIALQLETKVAVATAPQAASAPSATGAAAVKGAAPPSQASVPAQSAPPSNPMSVAQISTLPVLQGYDLQGYSQGAVVVGTPMGQVTVKMNDTVPGAGTALGLYRYDSTAGQYGIELVTSQGTIRPANKSPY